MRIKSFLAVFAAGVALSLSACAPQAELVDDTQAAPVSSEAAPADQGVSAMVGPCRLAWTCNYQRYYSTKSACTAACGSQPCEQDYACTGGCVCP